MVIPTYNEIDNLADIVARVRAVLTELLPKGEPGAAAVAAQLHLSERSLQRRLADARTGFSAVLKDTRHSLARSYLRDPQTSIGEIAYLLGFGDMSSFTRAFRRWEGLSPSEFRSRTCPVHRWPRGPRVLR